MTDTLGILALDCADVRLVRAWNCENLLLEEHRRLETFSHSLSFPRTMEVWPAVATGRHPSDTGVEGDANEWENPVLRAASTVTQYLPREVRATLGRPFERLGQQRTMAQTDAPTVFDDGVVRYWPGITPAEHLQEAWTLTSRINAGEMTDEEVRRILQGMTGEEFGWLSVAATWDAPIAGVHSHILDISGHLYATREAELRAAYEWVDERIGQLRDVYDRLVVLSDHGIQTGWLDDPDPGTHNFEALVAAQGMGEELPASVFDVAEWLSARVTATAGNDERATIDAPTEHLRDLGYLDG